MTIHKDGTITGLRNPVTQALGLKDNRITRILPLSPPLRWAFKSLRWMFGDSGRVAAMTRKFPGKWSLEILGKGVTCSGFPSHKLAVLFEHKLLQEREQDGSQSTTQHIEAAEATAGASPPTEGPEQVV